MSKVDSFRLWIVSIVFIIIYLVARFGVGLYTDFLWFQHLNFEAVFMTTLWTRVIVGLVVAVPFAVLFLANGLIARKQSLNILLFISDDNLVAQQVVVWAVWGASLFLGWAVWTAASGSWLLFLNFLNQQTFNLADPVFNMDVSFYLFSLPFYHFVQTWLTIALFISLIGSVAVYMLAQQNNLIEGRIVILPHVQLHLSIIGAFIFFSFAFGHWLDLFDLTYSPRGVAVGASYTDINVSIPALWAMIIVAVTTGVTLLINTVLRRPILSLGAIFIWVMVGIIGNGFIPNIIQRYVVEPNELSRETPYIQHNIQFTNIAYGLDKIQERDFPKVEPLTPQNLINNETALRNIRLWDYRPLQQTYQQIQAIRLYYRFLDIDLDRYIIDGELRQVALAARELDKRQLQSPTWVTQKMQFTHGYGVVVNPINEVTKEGLPTLWVKDLPPKSSVDLSIDRPEIYYGESEGDYVFVKTTEREFDYPSGDKNVFTQYTGTGGVTLGSFFKRVLFALRLSDTNMLLSQEFTNESRVLLYRNIKVRVNKVAPFLRYDKDPYLVIGTDGHLYWIQDAYTTSNRFPYSQPFDNLNYIRNSVKIVTDAYNGSMVFYVVDQTDPIISTYVSIFPDLFTPAEQMPDWVKAHLRYPEDLFTIQATLYQTYHMNDTNVFYNKEDLWQAPLETFSGSVQTVEPYYVIMKMPGENTDEFMLIQPFTPNNKDNLIAWMAARSDGEKYGQLVIYRFPKQELIFGPLQIEGRIDQNPEISSQITLWDQGGSEVIRGNLLVLPIDNSLLYVEPLYIRANNGQIPELKRVIIASGDKIVMEKTLAEGLAALFDNGSETKPLLSSSSETTPTVTDQTQTEFTTDDINQLIITASNHYEAAQEALKNGDWTTYGKELDKMQAALEALVRLTDEAK